MNIISGMHRSGTSITARLFFELGAGMGNADRFYPADKWNPDGYFEQLDVYAINTGLIHGVWGKFAYFRLPETEKILQRSRKFSPAIQQAKIRYEDQLVKAPHFCLTLPAWQRYGSPITKMLVCIREPIQVARSIQRRNGIPLNLALKLWHLHNTRLLENAKGLSLCFVDYKHLMRKESFVPEIRFASRFFNYSATETELEDLFDACVKTQLNHYQELVLDSYPQPIEELWGRLRTLHRAQSENVSEERSGGQQPPLLSRRKVLNCTADSLVRNEF